MSIPRKSQQFSRRQFLSIGGAAAAVALTPVPVLSTASLITVGRVKTALLLPDFTLAPHATEVFSAAFVKNADARFGVQTVSTGRGLTTHILSAVQTALAGGAQVIAAYINDTDADDVLALTEAAGAGLLVINHGENMPRTDLNSPRLAKASLHQWAEHYQHGRAVAARADRVVMMTSFYESGFDSAYAFRKGVEDGGSTVLKQFIVRDVAELEAAMDSAASLSFDTVYATFNGADAETFAQAWRLNMPVLSVGVTDMAAQFAKLGWVTAAALNRWDGAKFAPDLAELPQDALVAATRHAQTLKTGWLHPYMTL